MNDYKSNSVQLWRCSLLLLVICILCNFGLIFGLTARLGITIAVDDAFNTICYLVCTLVGNLVFITLKVSQNIADTVYRAAYIWLNS